METLAAIPRHNEGVAIGSVALKARKYVNGVLVVDDISTDDTAEVAAAAVAVIVSHEVNKGEGQRGQDIAGICCQTLVRCRCPAGWYVEDV